MKQPDPVFKSVRSALLELFPELLKLLFELLHFSRKIVNLLLQPRSSRRSRTRRRHPLLFRQRLDIDLAVEQVCKAAFLLSRLAWQARDEWIRIARDQRVERRLDSFQ